MRNTINYYYNLFPDIVYKQKDIFYFWLNDDKYYFVPFYNDKKIVLNIYEELIKNNKKVNKIVKNKESDLLTVYKNKNYVLFMVDCIENEIVDLNNFFNIQIKAKPIDWGIIWSQKIDYFEYQVSQRSLGKDNILNSFSYYVGLGENAIEYYNLLDKKDVKTAIQHKRLYAYNYEINYYNPLNMIYDYSVRDLAEYIKFSFFNDKLEFNKIKQYIQNLYLNSTMMNLLYIRLLFPSYYFDHYEKLLNDEEDERILIKIINKSIDYEKFLRDFYNFYGKDYNLVKIEWLFR